MNRMRYRFPINWHITAEGDLCLRVLCFFFYSDSSLKLCYLQTLPRVIWLGDSGTRQYMSTFLGDEYE